jgi:hypothetical protein
MDKLNLPNLIRFGLSGIVLYVYMYLTDSKTLKGLIGPLGIIGVPLAILIIGVLIYIIYRPLIYDVFITWLQDVVYKENCRNYLKSEAKKSNYSLGTYLAQRTYRILRDRHLISLYKESMNTWAATIHAAYQAAFLAIPFFIYEFVVNENLIGWFFVSAFVEFFFSGFLLDKEYERNEYHQIRLALNDEKCRNDFIEIIKDYPQLKK